MNVALVHDWLTGMRGGERVLERLCEMFPKAPIYTLLWNRGSVSAKIESHRIETSFIQKLPRAASSYRWYLPLFPQAIESFSLRGFDLVISTSHCAAKSIPVAPDTFHLSYIHTPMRYIWELERDYFPPDRFSWPLDWVVRSACARLRVWDVATSSRPDAMIANSRHVATRIHRHYGRQADVVYPPVAIQRLAPADAPRDGYLLAGAFAPYKRGELAVEACRRLGRRLRVIGTGPEERKLRAAADSSVEFHGWVDDVDMPGIYARARALIFPGEEDFGIVPVEALASGCPVLALGRGGVLETVGRGAGPKALEHVAAGGVAAVPGGVLFGEQSADAIVRAIELFESMTFDPMNLACLAQPFDEQRFDREFLSALERHHLRWHKQRGFGRHRESLAGPLRVDE